MTATFRCLGFDFGVTATNPTLQRTVDALYAPFRAPVEVTTQFTLVERAAPGPTGVSILIFENDQQVRTTPDRALALAHLVWRVSQHVIAVASESFLLLHAAAVERGRNAVLLPAPSGSGKSTLAAGLVAAGFGYLTDDVCAIDLETVRVRPYAKPISLAAGSRPAVRARRARAAGRRRARAHAHGRVHHRARTWADTSAARARRARSSCPRYAAGSRTELTAMSRAEAVIVLGEQSFNFNELAPDALPLAADLVRGCRLLPAHVLGSRRGRRVDRRRGNRVSGVRSRL